MTIHGSKEYPLFDVWFGTKWEKFRILIKNRGGARSGSGITALNKKKSKEGGVQDAKYKYNLTIICTYEIITNIYIIIYIYNLYTSIYYKYIYIYCMYIEYIYIHNYITMDSQLCSICWLELYTQFPQWYLLVSLHKSSPERAPGPFTLSDQLRFERFIWLVVEPSPLKNMNSLVGMMKFPTYGKS